MDDLVGTTLRGYSIIERIGSGGYGVVYRAQQSAVDREVAIKLILPSRAKSEYFKKRFDSEARLVAKLEHPYIVPLYEYWRDEDSAGLVMRWVAGGSLRGKLSATPMSLDATLKMVAQIGEALSLAHEHEIVHRDLKPDNILVDQMGNHFLTDFGIAKDLKGIITGDSTAGQVTGTPAYLSPEQGMGDKVTHRSDIYSLGVVVYEMLTGEHPFPGADPTRQILHHISDPLPRLSESHPHLPRGLDQFIEIATAKRPEARYDSVQECVAAFKAIVSPPGGASRAGHVPGILEKKLGVQAAVPSFLLPETQREPPGREVFVGRREPLARLDTFLEEMLAGKTQIVFVTGEAGRGKSALMHEFARRAASRHPALATVSGSCSLYTGVSDPYLPFRQALAMFTGDLDARWKAGEITKEMALRLWQLLPQVASFLTTDSPDLIDTLLPGRELAARAAAFDFRDGAWQSQLAELLSQKTEQGFTASSDQSQLYAQYTRLFKHVAAAQPVLLLLDDLHWIDQASVGLLVALGHELRTSPVLIVGAYRQDEILEREGRPHPLSAVISEFKRQFGDIWIDLDKVEPAEELSFVDEYLDSEPNRLSAGFRQALGKHTHGHALFTREILRDLQERGDLVKDEQGHWVESRENITWDHLPARVEGVIEKRLERLAPVKRRILEVACVEGERFSAEVVAAVLEQDVLELTDTLSQELDHGHQLVEDLGLERLNGSSLSRFRFSHTLLQSYLYQRLNPKRRLAWHRRIGEQLETLYSGHTHDIAALLAKHFDLAGDAEKAVRYYQEAGDHFRQQYAQHEAIRSYEAALRHLDEQDSPDKVSKTLMLLGLLYHDLLDFQYSQEAYDKAFQIVQTAGSFRQYTPLPQFEGNIISRWSFPTKPILDPGKTDTLPWANFFRQTFSGLVEVDPHIGIAPDVAREWKVSKDGLEYVFYLRPEACWSDGVPVSAHDFAFAWRRVIDPDNDISFAQYLFDIKNARAFHFGDIEDASQVGIQAQDDHTLKITMEHPASYFIHALQHNLTFPVPRHVVERWGEAWTEPGKMVSNGPFYLKELEEGKTMLLPRNPHYHGFFPGNRASINVSLEETTPEDLLQLYEEDRLHEFAQIESLSTEARRRVIKKYAVEYESWPEPNVGVIIFAHDQPPFNDDRVRRAFAMTVEKEQLAIRTWYNSSPAFGGVVPPGVPGHSPGIGLPHDADKARKLLAEAGYPGGENFPTVLYIDPFIGPLENPNKFNAERWRQELGILVERQNFNSVSEASACFRRGEAHIYAFGWLMDYMDPQNLVRAFATMGNYETTLPDTYRELSEQAIRTHDPAKRLQLYQQLDKYLIESALIVPTIYGRRNYLRKPWYKAGYYGPTSPYWGKSGVFEDH